MIFMTDPEKQSEFIAGLRKKAEELAASNPVIGDMRSVGRALVGEARTRTANGNARTSIGAYLMDGSISFVESEATETQLAEVEILSKLKTLALEGQIQAAATCKVVDRQVPGGSLEKYVDVHMEHFTGKALNSSMPVDESALIRGVPGVDGPSVRVFGGPVKPRIFVMANPPVLKISAMANGRITVDGLPATIDSVRVSLKRLAEQGGVVWYYREDAKNDGPPEAKQIVQAVIENRLSIRLSSRPDYSDSIGPGGEPITGNSPKPS
jgi:hypothetical protein